MNYVTYFHSYVMLKRSGSFTFEGTFKIFIMPILNIVIVLIVVGVLLWLVNTYIPMDGKIKKILNVVVVIAVVLWLLKIFGLFDSMRTMHT